MPPAYVKPYVKRRENDAADAEAICEAVTQANMRFVETKARSPSFATPRLRHRSSTLAHGTAGSSADQGRCDRVANKLARMAWAMMATGERHKKPATLAA